MAVTIKDLRYVLDEIARRGGDDVAVVEVQISTQDFMRLKRVSPPLLSKDGGGPQAVMSLSVGGVRFKGVG